ncbi:MAG: hypothetical protein NVS9B15_15990 [Acidobacteriaceae bacterium]
MGAAALPLTETTPARTVWFPFHLMLAALIGAMVFFFVGGSIADPDIWWHLKNAQILVEQHHWVRFDTYSFTVTGTPWVNSEWLSEVIYFLAWKFAGLRGIFGLYAAMAELIMFGVLWLSYQASGSIKSAFLATAVAVTLAVVNFGPRTILFGWACLLVLLIILWQLLREGSAPLWVIPLIFAFWVNLHGSWLIGLVVYAIVFACGFIDGTFGQVVATRWTSRQARALLLTGVSILPALLLNPYGYKTVFYPFDMAYRQKLNIANVEEWASIDFHQPRGKLVLLLLFSVLALALTRKKTWKLPEIAMTVFALYASLSYVRFLFMAGILIAPILARHLDFVAPYKKDVDRSWLNAVIVAALCAFMFHRLPSSSTLADDLSKKFPSRAVQFLQAHPGERTVNHYTYGGYLIWSSPAVATFIDSRTDIFEYRGVLKDYLDLIQLKQSVEVLDKYKAHFVLFPKADPLSYLLRHDSSWKVAYEDERDEVFERVNLTP